MEQYRIQRLIDAFNPPKWVIVRYGVPQAYGVNGDSKVVDIYDVPRQKAPEGTYEKCLELAKIMFSNQRIGKDELATKAYSLVDIVEEQLTDDYARIMRHELEEKHKNEFVDRDFWETTRKQKDGK